MPLQSPDLVRGDGGVRDLAAVSEAGRYADPWRPDWSGTPNGPVHRSPGEGGCLRKPAKPPATGLTATCSGTCPDGIGCAVPRSLYGAVLIRIAQNYSGLW